MARSKLCPQCGFDNIAGAAFCGRCGQALPQEPEALPAAQLLAPCPVCGHENTPEATFCGMCGSALPARATSAALESPAPDTAGAAAESSPCPTCGATNPPEAVFCGNCGASLAPGGLFLATAPLPAQPRRRGRLPALAIAAGLLFALAVAAYVLLPRLNLDLPPALAGLMGEASPTAIRTEPLATSTPLIAEVSPVPTKPLATPTPPIPEASPVPTEPPATPTLRPTATEPPTPNIGPQRIVLGTTARGTPIEAVRFGHGETALVFVGGLAAGFAPGTVALAERLVDYLSDNPPSIPESLTVYVVLSASPDAPLAPGEHRGRLNSNGVDINRNWDCQWAADTLWRGELKRGSGGTAPFSEAESLLLRDFIFEVEAKGVIFWQALAQNGLVSPGSCGSRSEVSASLAGVYGLAAGYRVEDFENMTEQQLNGDASNYLDAAGIPTVSVLLPSYNGVDWESNLDGILAVLDANQR